MTVPNQLVIVMDDMKTDLLGHLPNITALAARGTSFLHRLNTSLCQVYRVTFFTGQYSKTHGVHDNQDSTLIAQGFPHAGGSNYDLTIQKALANAGVWCGFIGKEFNFGGWTGEHPPGAGWSYFRSLAQAAGSFYSTPQQLSLGYTVWDGTTTSTPAPYYLDQLYTYLQAALAAATSPWFIEVAVTSPHVPLNPKPEDNHGWEDYDYEVIAETNLAKRPSWVRGRAPISSSDLYHIRDYVRRSLREATAVDRFVQDALGLVSLDNTDVIVTNDNSIHAGEALMRLNDSTGEVFKNSPYDAAIKVPCICAGPSYPADGRYVNVPTSNIDLPATLLATAGATPLLPTQHGVDLRDVAVNSATYASRQLLHQHRFNGYPDVDSISTLTRKLNRYTGTYPNDVVIGGVTVHHAGDTVAAADEYELYDLQNDPHELNNRANDGGSWATDVTTLDAALTALLAAG